MDRKIRVGAVSYRNTKPLLYGFEQGMMKDEVELLLDYPARIASMLINDSIDIGLVPVAAIPLLKDWHLVTDFCIGSIGAVASVCIFSEVPMAEIKTVMLDYQSRTSVQLAKILLKDYWHSAASLRDAKEDFRANIKGTTAGVVIGDRALEQRKISPYIYDLGEAWFAMTGLPFVFAAWISNKQLGANFIARFSAANAAGFDHLGEIVSREHYEVYNLMDYYTKCISYHLDSKKQEGLDLFLQKLTSASQPLLAEHRY